MINLHIDHKLVEDAAYRIFHEVRRRGITAEEIAEWQPNCFFPWLRSDPAIVEVVKELCRKLPYDPDTDIIADPQILLRFPDAKDEPLVPPDPHTDTLPPWAPRGSFYRWIAGVALTDSRWGNGALVVYPDGSNSVVVSQRTGDVVAMPPDLKHSGSANHSGSIRAALYVRLIGTGGQDGVGGIS